MFHAVYQPGLFRPPHCSTSPPASDAIKSQEVNVLTGNSSLLWQLGEFCEQEPSVPPNVNLGPAVRNSNGQTGIWSHWAARRPLQLPWICLSWYLPGCLCYLTAGLHRLRRNRSTLLHLHNSLWASHCSEESFWFSSDQFSPECRTCTFDVMEFRLFSPECQTCTFNVMEFRPISFSTPTHLHLSIFQLLSASQFCLYISNFACAYLWHEVSQYCKNGWTFS